MNVTIKDLRSLLFEIQNQDMTVRELRYKLFNIDEYYEFNDNSKRKLRNL